jgi:putative DNA primase/helicase
VYQDGIYQSGTEAVNKAMIKIMPGIKKAQRSEVMDYLNIICEERFPAKPTLIAFQNGIYDLESDSFKDFSPDIVITNKIPWPYNPAAYNELMDHTLDKIACNRPEIRALLEEIVGSCFYRSNTLGGGKAFILIGDKSNGKSTLLSVLQSLLGRENTSSLDLKELGDRFKTAELFGKLANIGDDISGDYISNAAVLKKMITGNRINVERKGQDPFEFDNYAKMLFSANDIPTIGKTKEYEAVERRFIFIPFDARFDKTDPDYDPQILDKLKQQDSFEYLILLGLNGLKQVLKNKGYSEGKASENAKEEYRIEHNSILAFIDELGLDAIVNEPTSAVYQEYNGFCNANGFEPVKKPTFTKKLLKALNLDVGYGKDRSGKTIKVYVKK